VASIAREYSQAWRMKRATRLPPAPREARGKRVMEWVGL
jgi:hypothetical protein